jgi:hypothetical protein
MPRQLAFFLVLCLRSLTCCAQTYTLQSFDGTPAKVRVCYRYQCNTLRVTTDRDTLYFDDWWAPDAIRVIGKHFLQISYAVRGGSNLGLGDYLLLSVKDHQLIESVFFLSYSEWEAFEHMTYEVRPILLGNDPGTYRLALDIRSADSTRAGIWTFSRHDRDTLSFDPGHQIFYNRRSLAPGISLGRTYFTDNLSYSYINNLWSEDDSARDSQSRRH